MWTSERGDVAVRDVQPGDHVMLQGPGFGRRALSSRLALAIGAAVGDGCLTRARHGTRAQETVVLTMAASEAPVLEGIAATVNDQKRVLRTAGMPGRPDEVRVSTSGMGGAVSRLAFASRVVVDAFKNYAVLDEGSHLKRFTRAVYELDRSSTAALLRGLFTADGTVANHGDVSLDSSSLELLQQVQLLLLGFGIKSKLYRERRGGLLESVLPDGRALPPARARRW